MQESFLEQKVFLNTELKPYINLTREEKHMLLDAVFDSNCEVYDIGLEEWDDKTNSEFFNTSIYRTKPKEHKKLDIHWSCLRDIWKYAAMDENGDVYLYEDKPVFEITYWNNTDSSEGEMLAAKHLLKLDTTGIVAEHSLTERPEE